MGLVGPRPRRQRPGLDHRDPTVLANSFLMPRGYTMVWSGWDKFAGTSTANFNMTVTLPIATNPDGSSITGPAYEYIVTSGTSFTLSYPAATADQTQATLTHRVHLDDLPEVIPASEWEYTDASLTAIRLLPAGTSFVANDIYEFSYTAKDPSVNGLGFAAIRDWNAWLRYEAPDDFGTPNPLAGDITRISGAVCLLTRGGLIRVRHAGGGRMWSCPLTLSPWSPTQQGRTCTPTLDWRCALALPECPHVLYNGLHLQKTPKIAILDHALPVD